MQQRRLAYVLSLLLFIMSIVSLSINHLNLGLDFNGGVQMEEQGSGTLDPVSIRRALGQKGYDNASVVRYGNASTIEITVGRAHVKNSDQEQARQALSQTVQNLLPGATLGRVDYVGPKVGRALAEQGVLAIFGIPNFYHHLHCGTF